MPKKIGRYKILDTLGEGAMGVVYKARDPKFGRIVALKAIRSGEVLPEGEKAEFFKRFSREAHAAGSLSHPSIVKIFDTDRDSRREISYITMEYVEGKSLEDLFHENGPFSADQALVIAIQAAKGLGYAHKREVVHRDIKPANILLNIDGTVRITDFGIAKVSASTLTTSGQFLGTPSYMSPEQVLGDEADGRSDLFSLTIVLYQLVTGELPFPGNNITTIAYKIVNTDPPPPTHINCHLADGFDSLIARGMARNPADRFQTADEMITELKALYRQDAPDGVSTAQTVQQRDQSGQSTVVADSAPTVAVPETVVARGTRQQPNLTVSVSDTPSIPSVPNRTSISQVLLGAVSGLSVLLLSFFFIYPLLVSSSDEPLSAPPAAPRQQIVNRYDLTMLTADSSPAANAVEFAADIPLPDLPDEIPAPARTAGDGHGLSTDRQSTEVQDPTESLGEKSQDVIDGENSAMVVPDSSPAGTLNLVLRHPFVAGRLVVFADNQPVYESELGQMDGEGSTFKKNLKVLGRKLKLASHQAEGIRIPVGLHQIEVEVVRPDGSVLPRAGLAANFVAGGENCLSILCSRKKSKKLQLEWDDAE